MLFKKKIHQTEKHKLIKEANLEARKEKIKVLLKKYQKSVVWGLVGIVILIILIIAFNAYQKSREEKYSAILQQITMDSEKNNVEAARVALKGLYEDTSVPAGIRSLASLKYGAILLNNDRFDEAIAVYTETNKNKKFDPYIRELSGLIALKAMIDSNSRLFEERIIRLEEDLENNSKILKYFIIEQKGIFEWNRDNFKIANDIFKNLADNPEVAQSIKLRAKEMSDIYYSKYDFDKNKITNKSGNKASPTSLEKQKNK